MTSLTLTLTSMPIPIQGENSPCNQDENEPIFLPNFPINEQKMWEEKRQLHEQVALCVHEIVEKVIFNLEQEEQLQENEELFFGDFDY